MLKQKKNTKSISTQSAKSKDKQATGLFGLNDIDDIWAGGITLDLTRWTRKYEK